tara:strand:- start:37 stop:582 length:546 start_codon:yes stop_codon:yes gene_type:complete
MTKSEIVKMMLSLDCEISAKQAKNTKKDDLLDALAALMNMRERGDTSPTTLGTVHTDYESFLSKPRFKVRAALQEKIVYMISLAISSDERPSDLKNDEICITRDIMIAAEASSSWVNHRTDWSTRAKTPFTPAKCLINLHAETVRTVRSDDEGGFSVIVKLPYNVVNDINDEATEIAEEAA